MSKNKIKKIYNININYNESIKYNNKYYVLIKTFIKKILNKYNINKSLRYNLKNLSNIYIILIIFYNYYFF